MLRFLAFTLVCFLAPFAIYGFWRRFGGEAGNPDGPWPFLVIVRLCGIGVLCVLLAIGVIVSFQGGRPGTTYHPATLENGQLKQGEFD